MGSGGSMSFLGAVGVVAQQGNQGGGSGPTNVIIQVSDGGATGFITEESTGGWSFPAYTGTFSEDGDPAASSHVLTISAGELEDGYEADHFSHTGYIEVNTFAWLAADGASTYAWSGSIADQQFNESIVATVEGSSNDVQMALDRGGTGIKLRLTLPVENNFPNPNEYTTPEAGDHVYFTLTGIASGNSIDVSDSRTWKVEFIT